MNLEIIKYKVKSNNKRQSKTPEEIEKIRKYNREYYASVRKSKNGDRKCVIKNKIQNDIEEVVLNTQLVKIELGGFIVEF